MQREKSNLNQRRKDSHQTAMDHFGMQHGKKKPLSQ